MNIVCDDHDDEYANNYDEDLDDDQNLKNCDDGDVEYNDNLLKSADITIIDNVMIIIMTKAIMTVMNELMIIMIYNA